MNVLPMELDKAVELAAAFSDRGTKGLRAWGAQFILAHQRRPNGLSIEVGTNIGGSALLFGQLLEKLYPVPPPLWTVDPYGSKPYVGGHGDRPEQQPPIYTEAYYQAMKRNLMGAAYHTHWLMPSLEFFDRMYGLPYWRPGSRMLECIEVTTRDPLHLPIGEEHRARDATFILLDGEHSARSICFDVEGALRWLAPGGVIVIDNIDTDPETVARLESMRQLRDLPETSTAAARTTVFALDVSAGEWAVITNTRTA